MLNELYLRSGLSDTSSTPVIPGDTLIISVNVTMSTKSAFEFACVIKVDGEVRAKGNLLFTTMNKNAVYKPSQE